MAQHKPRIVSGIQPSGKLHVGNYLGAIKNFIELQNSNKYDCFFFIADLHSLTETFDPKEKTASIYETLAGFLALGLDPKKSTIFLQSHVTGHTELAWLFSCVTPITELERMTQYKDKAARQKANINAGLLTYPILQAADVLLYNGETVPVGQDQDQHVELIRVIAKKMNSRFGTTFPEPKSLHTTVPKVMSLKDPAKKMSKSLGDAHVLNLFDDKKITEAKIRKATTGTNMEGPAYENFISLIKELSPDSPMLALHAKKAIPSYSQLKEALAMCFDEAFADSRLRFNRLIKNTHELDAILVEGKKRAQPVADKTLSTTKEKMGILL